MGPSAEQQQRDLSSNFVAKMPGDEGTHPLAETGRNPFPGWSVLAISRALRDGRIADPTLERKARAYLSQYQRLTGEVIYDPRKHVPEHPTEQQYADESTVSPLRCADPFNSSRNVRFGGPKVR